MTTGRLILSVRGHWMMALGAFDCFCKEHRSRFLATVKPWNDRLSHVRYNGRRVSGRLSDGTVAEQWAREHVPRSRICRYREIERAALACVAP